MNLNDDDKEIEVIKKYVEQTWGRLFDLRVKVKLNELFPEPENKGLKHIWKYGHGDLVVFKAGNPRAIIEVGGVQHLQDEKQMRNDRRKWTLADINGVRCISMMNGLINSISKRKFRAMFSSVLFRQP